MKLPVNFIQHLSEDVVESRVLFYFLSEYKKRFNG